MQETVLKQSQQSLSNLPVLYTRDDSQSIEYNPIQGVVQLYTTLSEKETLVVYQKAAEKTWELFKQAFGVILFLVRLLIALIIWAYGIAYQSGYHLRNWLEVEQGTPDIILFALLKFLKQAGKHAYEWATSFIKKYLGLEIKFNNSITEKPSATETEETTASGEGTIK